MNIELKAKTDLNFVEKVHFKQNQSIWKLSKKLAVYKDRNKNVILSSVQVEEEKLQSEFDLAFSVYSAFCSKAIRTS